MICNISDLQYKEVIDIADGTRYGYIGDVEIDAQNGTIESVIISGKPRWFGLLGREPDTSESRRNGWYMAFGKIPIEQGEIAFAEFTELLQNDRYQLELTNTFVGNHTDAVYSDSFDFTYIGTNPDVTQAHNISKTEYYNVHLFLLCSNNTGNASLCIHYSSAFTLEDPGVYTTADIPASSSGGGSGGAGGSGGDRDPTIPEFARQDCLTCGGSGDCTRCGGDGYTYNDDIRSSCSRCHGSGDCSACGGTGKR